MGAGWDAQGMNQGPIGGCPGQTSQNEFNGGNQFNEGHFNNGGNQFNNRGNDCFGSGK